MPILLLGTYGVRGHLCGLRQRRTLWARAVIGQTAALPTPRSRDELPPSHSSTSATTDRFIWLSKAVLAFKDEKAPSW
jgi:hypothetical protein